MAEEKSLIRGLLACRIDNNSGLVRCGEKNNILASALFDAFFGKIGVSFCFLVIGRLGKIGAIFCFFVTVEICESAEDFRLCLCE